MVWWRWSAARGLLASWKRSDVAGRRAVSVYAVVGAVALPAARICNEASRQRGRAANRQRRAAHRLRRRAGTSAHESSRYTFTFAGSLFLGTPAMRQPQAARRRAPRQTALTSGAPRRAAPRRDESTCKLRRLLTTPSDDEVIQAALKGLPVRNRPPWLIEYLVDVNHLPIDPVPQHRMRSTTRTQHASPRLSPITTIGKRLVLTTLQSDSSECGEANVTSASPRALPTQTPVRPALSRSAEVVPAPAPAPALCGPVHNKRVEAQVAGGAVSVAGGNALPHAQQYMQEALDALAMFGYGQPSREKELPPPEPLDLRLLPAGFRIAQCGWDDRRLRQLNLQFAAEDAPHAVAKVSPAAHAESLGGSFGVANAAVTLPR